MCHHKVVVFETKTIFPRVAFPKRRKPKRRKPKLHKAEPPPKPNKLLNRCEIYVLETLYKTHGNVEITAQELGLKPSTVYVIRGRVRDKVEKAREFLKEVRKYQRVLGTSQLR
jgi:hypothetical protein